MSAFPIKNSNQLLSLEERISREGWGFSISVSGVPRMFLGSNMNGTGNGIKALLDSRTDWLI